MLLSNEYLSFGQKVKKPHLHIVVFAYFSVFSFGLTQRWYRMLIIWFLVLCDLKQSVFQPSNTIKMSFSLIFNTFSLISPSEWTRNFKKFSDVTEANNNFLKKSKLKPYLDYLTAFLAKNCIFSHKKVRRIFLAKNFEKRRSPRFSERIF